jgi:hypothetical protein
MTARRSESGKKPKVERLELSRETVQDLTESEGEAAVGGRPAGSSHRPGCPAGDAKLPPPKSGCGRCSGDPGFGCPAFPQGPAEP